MTAPRTPSVLAGLCLCFTALPVLSGCSESEAATESASAAPATSTIADQPIEEWRTELLDLAFQAASKFPTVPHRKNRARHQDAVVAACFELDQPRRALGYASRIDNWRRGSGYADFAYYCAVNGDVTEVDKYIDEATKIAVAEYNDPDSQAWRADRIRAKIASTYVMLGDDAKAAKYSDGIEVAEAARVESARATFAVEDQFDATIEQVDAVTQTGNFEQVRVILNALTGLHERFYDDDERRETAEAKVQSSWSSLPITLRMELLWKMAGTSIDRGYPERAIPLIDASQEMIDENRWTNEHYVPLVARVATMRHHAGQTEEARRQADEAYAFFEDKCEAIVDVFRSETIVPLAEAYQEMGYTDQALVVYRRAVEEGVKNPNSRPRVEDVGEVMRSMAVHGAEPDEEFRARLKQIVAELDHPW